MSNAYLTLLLWVMSLIANIIGWYFLAKKQDNKELLERLTKLERTRNKVIGFVLAEFGVDLNGD